MSTSRSDGDATKAWPYDARPSTDTRVGVSLSGGGIRSATFCLGVYQRLAEAGIFQRARFLSAVSGGSYLAAALAISNGLSSEPLQMDAPHAWMRGSPEEARLRRNLSYLAPGVGGRMWLFANLLYGLILNLTPLVLCAFLCGRAVGLVLRELYPGLGMQEKTLDTSAMPWIAALSVMLVLGSLLVVGGRRFLDKKRSRGKLKASRSEGTVTVLLSGAVLLVVLGIGLPAVVNVLGRSTTRWISVELGIDRSSWQEKRVLVGLGGVALAVGIGAASVWLFRRRRLWWLRGALAAISGAGVLVVPFVMSAETAAVRGVSLQADAITWLACGGVILLFAVFAHNRRYSMHLFYRERIQEAFALRRVPAQGEALGFDVESIPYEESVLLSEVAARNTSRSNPPFPELVMCAAVAAHGSEVPSKTWAASFTFEGDVSGNARLKLQAPTTDVEAGDWIGGGNLTLPAMMAISGAAVSPLMGRFTVPAFRFLMAVLNIRLGVWIRNPHRRVDTSLPPTSQPLRRVRKYLLRGWHEPGAWYVLKEGLGLADTHGRYIYVSDGGHWENLGLTELLRRRCTHLIVVDASGDSGLGDIARAIAVSRAELGVEIRLDPRATLPASANLAERPVAVGSFCYPDGQEGDIYYARSVLWDTAPSDLHLFKARESVFPNHPTSNQFLSGELFDAYRALGWAVGEELVSAVSLPPPSFDEVRVRSGRFKSEQSDGLAASRGPIVRAAN